MLPITVKFIYMSPRALMSLLLCLLPQVDDRLNGDGVGLALGVNDPVLAWQMAGVVLVLWALYYAAQKDFGNFEDPDSGLDL